MFVAGIIAHHRMSNKNVNEKMLKLLIHLKFLHLVVQVTSLKLLKKQDVQFKMNEAKEIH